MNETHKQNLQEVQLSNHLGKGRFHCLVDRVEWDIWHCTVCWQYKDGKNKK